MLPLLLWDMKIALVAQTSIMSGKYISGQSCTFVYYEQPHEVGYTNCRGGRGGVPLIQSLPGRHSNTGLGQEIRDQDRPGPAMEEARPVAV